ncbi:hypothetical protein GCM10022393_22560 [Aquimarina addita]|uniref:Peptidase M3 n=1 Tax=Aquimarina addita TaxID=870485 RepID=A0ABP6UJZ9_9FLAO
MKTQYIIHKQNLIIIGIILTCMSCNKTKEPSKPKQAEEKITNILLREWTGPYGGVPAFDQMNIMDVKPALEKGMMLHLNDIDKITENKEEPTFENTIIPYEKAGAELDRALKYYGILSSNMSSPEFRNIRKEMAPLISDFRSKISQNEELFKRIETIYNNALKQPLEADQQRVVQLIYEEFAMNGATLDTEKKKRYAAINKELSGLYTNFSSNILADEEKYVTYLTKEQLGGLPEPMIKAYAKAATDKGKENSYAITNTRSSMDPFLTYATDRSLREKVWRTYYSRGDNGDEKDTKDIIVKILQLRKERVALLGYDNFADWRLQNRMARNPENAMKLMNTV